MPLLCHTLATQLGELCKAKNIVLVTAESCTGGLVAATITNVPGSSQWFDSGFITYSNAAKQTLLGVPELTLVQRGAVSEETALAMAKGALKRSRAHISVAVTGIAGPEGGSDAKPVGTVWFAFAHRKNGHESYVKYFNGDRATIRAQATEFAITHLIRYCEHF